MSDPTGARLADTVQRLVDRQAIEDLLHTYCRCADLNDPDGLAACFTEDCFADYGGGVGQPARGRKARRREAARDLALFSATSHHLSNIMITFEGADRARVMSTVHAWHRTVDGSGEWNLRAQYHDTVVRTSTGWLISSRRMLVAGADGFPRDWTWLPLGRRPSDTSL